MNRRKCATTAETKREREISQIKSMVIGTVGAVLLYVLIVALVVMLTGCGGLKRPDVVVHPDAAMLIVEAKGYAKVSMPNPQTGQMEVIGSIDLSTYKGWTLSKYDWTRPVRPD